MQRYLVCKGLFWGTKKVSQHYCLKYHTLENRNKYVQHMMKEKVARQRRIVYMDDSYIHKNYCCHEESLYDQNYKQDFTTIAHHKGQLYCFIASIVDADHSVPYFERTDAQKVVLLHDTLDIFKGVNKHAKDYHGMFNHEFFVVWMHKLLYALKIRTLRTILTEYKDSIRNKISVWLD